MKIVSQLSVFLENKPGAFARVCSTFAREKINLDAIMVEDAIDHAVVRLVVDKTKKAKDLLEDHGAVCLEGQILAIEMKNKPGQLVQVAEKLAKANINVDYAYGSSAAVGGEQVTIYVRVADPNAALEVLKG